MTEIIIENAGPVRRAVLPYLEEGGVVEVTGYNGSGKSTILRAIDTAVSGRGRVEPSDGAVAAKVEAFGITIKARHNQTRTGELEVVSLEGRFSIVDLVDPKIKDPGAADAKRIKALIQLTGQKAEPSLFYNLVGTQKDFQDGVSLKAMQADDLVVMASQIKRDLEAKARELKEAAEKENITATAGRQAVEGVDVSLPCEEKKLAEDHLLVVQELERLKAVRNASAEAEKKIAAARSSLESVEQSYKGPTVQQVEDRLVDLKSRCSASAQILERAEEAVRVARQEHARNQLNLQHAEDSLETARAHEAAMRQWHADLGIVVPQSNVTAEDIVAAEADVEAALQAIQTGALIRDANRRLAEAAAHSQAAARLQTQADRLNDAAKNTDVVLSEVVQRLNCPLRVHGGRLVTATDRSEQELFAELSRGEQWRIALDIAIEAVGAGGVLVIDQEGWEGIDPINRQQIREHLIGTRVTLYAARCSDNELRVEAA